MDDIHRGNEASSILRSDVYQESFRLIEDRLVTQLAIIEITPERAEYLRTLLVANRKIRSYLEQVMQTGKMFEIDEERKSLMQRMKDGVKSMVVRP